MMTETTMTPTTIEAVPCEIAEAYDIDPERITKLGGGLVNLTFVADAPSGRLALQRLAPDTPCEAIDDFAAYTAHLRAADWHAPVIRRTVDGQDYRYDQTGNLWRGMEYIECDPEIPTDTASTGFLESTGTLLARWHHTMSWLEYQPRHQIPHFHDSLYHVQKLRDLSPLLPTASCQALAAHAIRAYAGLEPLPEAPAQLIHGDPKLANMLFRDGKPFTLIDFDTVMHGPIWHDIGDLLRSNAKANLDTERAAVDTVRAISTGDFDAARPGIRLGAFFDKAILATQHISLELLARYLNDVVEENYFTWDDTRFATRADNHLSRAQDQWRVFQQLQDKE